MRCSLLVVFALVSQTLRAQVDTIFSAGEKIPCAIKEVSPDAVQFTYPNETLLNTMYKTNINKIVFRSGRIQTFSESMALSPISNINDYPKVVITQLEGEVKGLHKVGEVSSSSRGGTAYSNIDRVKERALNKLKMEAVMRGANVIYMSYQKMEGNHYGGYFQSAKAAETFYNGVAYSNVLPNKAAFTRKLEGVDLLTSTQQVELYKGAAIAKAEYEIRVANQDIAIKGVSEEGGLLSVEAIVRGFNTTSFRVVRFDDYAFTLLAEDKNKLVNYIIPFKQVGASQAGSSRN